MRHRHSDTGTTKQLAGIAMLAAAIGAVTALLFTPRTGNQVRRGLFRRAKHVKDEVADHLPQAKKAATDVVKPKAARTSPRVKRASSSSASRQRTTRTRRPPSA